MEIRQKLQTVKLSKLVPNTWNYNEQSEEMLDKTKENVKHFGLMRPLVVREVNKGKGSYFEIINGYHRFIAAKELGFKEVLINNLGSVTDSEAKMLTVLLNELKGTPNAVKLAGLIDGLYGSDSWETISELLPFDDVEVENFMKIAAEAGKEIIEASKEEDEEKDVVYQMVVTDGHAETIDKALDLFEESLTVGEKFYEIILEFQGKEEN